MNCEGCLNRGDCKVEIMETDTKDERRESLVAVIKFCPKCKKQAAEYRFNEAGNLAFYECIHCGYSAADYARDLREGK